MRVALRHRLLLPTCLGGAACPCCSGRNPPLRPYSRLPFYSLPYLPSRRGPIASARCGPDPSLCPSASWVVPWKHPGPLRGFAPYRPGARRRTDLMAQRPDGAALQIDVSLSRQQLKPSLQSGSPSVEATAARFAAATSGATITLG